VPRTIPRWSESRRSLVNRGPQRSASPTLTPLARPGTTPNSPASWPGSTWCCRTGCRSFGRSTFVEPACLARRFGPSRGRRGVVRRYHQSRRSGFRVGGIARRADGTVDRRQSGAVPKRCVPCVGDAFTLLSGRRSFAPPWMQRMGLIWATVMQGTAPTRPALPAI
jgi:hypothetical protein